MKKISIIIPFYKGEKYIVNTVNNLLELAYPLEIIIIDDGSPNDGYDFCLKKFNCIENVKVFTKKNGGIVSARNVGLKKAKGDYILFIDQDDCVNVPTLTEALKILDGNYAIDILFWSTQIVTDGNYYKCDTVLTEDFVDRTQIINYVLPSMLRYEANHWFSYTGHVWATVYRNEFVRKNNIHFHYFVDYEDDYLFVFDSLIKANTVFFMKDVGYYWTVNTSSYSYNPKVIDDYIERADRRDEYLLTEYKKIANDDKKVEVIKKYLSQKTIIDAFLNCCSGNEIKKTSLQTINKLLKKEKYQDAIYRTKPLLHDKRYKIMLKLLRLTSCSVTAFFFKVYFIIKRWRQIRVRQYTDQ